MQEWVALCAHDSASVGEASPLKKLRACVVWGLVEFFRILRAAGDWLSDREVAQLQKVKPFIFDGYNKLSKEAARRGAPLYKFIPKHHVFFHIYRDMLRTRRNAARLWTFSDEENMMNMSSIVCAVHASSVGNRTLQRWLLQFCG